MCGIIGILSNEAVSEGLIDGLRRLEYRGYDSAGIATIFEGKIHRRRAEGKISKLEKLALEQPILGNVGIGHTRWATHGAPIEKNAHPHATEKVAVVHNGIIENFAMLRAELESQGVQFNTDTDTEVIPQLITHYLESGDAIEMAAQKAISRLEGAYALGIIYNGDEKMLIAARHGSPLALGYGMGERQHEFYLGSDAMALIHLTNSISYLEEGDIAYIRKDGVTILDSAGKSVSRPIEVATIANISIGKENYRHFMLKEIYEQPGVVGNVLRAYGNSAAGDVTLPPVPFDLSVISRVTMVACGTSYYAACVARYWCESVAKIPVDCDIASEFRYRGAPLEKGGVAIFVSQSGETADTLAAMRYAKSQGQHCVAVVNVTQSSMAREADLVLPTYSGPEIGVASTKAFTTQLVALALFTLKLARESGKLTAQQMQNYMEALGEVPSRMATVLQHDGMIEDLAQEISLAQDILYIGRGVSFPIAMEGALKLKEISYIHAEAAAAGELKHGPIALVDEDVPVIAIAPSDQLFEKTASNIREVAARGGRIILISDEAGVAALSDVIEEAITIPSFASKELASFLAPILYAVPIQLLAYHVAVAKGTDVDQPRNLAKSVTVE